MTEPHLRDLYAFLDAHRLDLIDHAGSTAEIAALLRTADMRTELSALLARLANRLQTLSMSIAGSLSEMERVYPLDVLADEDTDVSIPRPDPDADTVPDIVPAGLRKKKRLTGRRVK